MTAAAKTLAQALLAFHKNAPSLPLDGTNPHFNNKFTTLGAVMERVRGPLAEQGLTVAQFPTTVEGQPALRTRLTHESGEFIEDTMLLMLAKADPQGQGAGLTYARRQALLAVLSLVGDEDDDGNQASAPRSTRSTPAQTAEVPPGASAATLTAAQKTSIKKLVAECAALPGSAMTLERAVANYGGSLDKLTDQQAHELITKLSTYKASQEKAA